MLALGGVVVVYFSLLLRVEHTELHLLLVAWLTGTIALCLWLVAIINSPFAGGVQVSTAPLHYALHVIDLLPR